jgi:hypothetical protein
MQIDNIGAAIAERVNHANCKTSLKMDDLWECLTDTAVRCPDQVPYGPSKYCAHRDSTGFGARFEG